jgi:phage/plasmid-associated DNA primase
MEHATGDSSLAKEILEKILRIIGKDQHPVQWLTREIMKEYTFKTMTDNEEIYYYDSDKGVYKTGAEWLIKEMSELMFPKITTHQRYEVINHIKARTGVDRSHFDVDVNILNTANGLLNIQTNELSPHRAEYLSLVQLTTEYSPDAKCPQILEFFKDVLRPDEVDVMFRLIGYCLHKNCEYEKAAMLYGTGANGKGVVIRIIERFLGDDNCSHRVYNNSTPTGLQWPMFVANL